MKRTTMFITMIMSLTLLCAGDSFAYKGDGPGYRWQGSGGWGMGTPYQRMYEPAKMETIKGTVEALETLAPMRGMHKAVALKVKVDSETMTVHLGPEWYISRLDTKIVKGDKVEVKGMRATFDNKPAIIAAEVKRGDDVLVLRNESGAPVWAGWRRQ